MKLNTHLLYISLIFISVNTFCSLLCIVHIVKSMKRTGIRRKSERTTSAPIIYNQVHSHDDRNFILSHFPIRLLLLLLLLLMCRIQLAWCKVQKTNRSFIRTRFVRLMDTTIGLNIVQHNSNCHKTFQLNSVILNENLPWLKNYIILYRKIKFRRLIHCIIAKTV